MAISVFKILGKIAIDKGNSDKAIEETAKKGENLSSKLQTVSEKTGSFAKTASLTGAALTAGLTTPITMLGKKVVNLASDYNESLNKTEVAFGSASDKVVEFSETSLKTFGVSKGAALDMASLFGDMATSMGLPQDAAADMSTSLVGLAGDLSSFKNISTDQAMTALNGIFTGETESLKTLGIVMTQTNLDAYALANGYGKTTDEMTQAEQVQLRYNYVLSMTENAQGDYARTSDGTANSIRTFQGTVEELGTAFGEKLLPIITPIIQGLTNMLNKLGEMPEGAQKFIIVLLGIAASIGPVLVGLGSVAGAISKISALLVPGAKAMETAGTTAVEFVKNSEGITTVVAKAGASTGGFGAKILSLGSAISANLPLILGIGAAVAAVVAILVGAYKNSEKFRDSITSTIQNVEKTFRLAVTKIQVAFKPAIDEFKKGWATLQPIIEKAQTLISNVLQWIGDFLATYIMPIVSWVLDFVVAGLGNIISAMAPFLTAIGNVFNFIVNVLGVIISLLLGDWSGAMEYGKQALQSLLDAVINIWNGIWSTISAVLQIIWTLIQTIWDNIFGFISGILSNIWKTITDAWNGILTDTKNLLTSMFDAFNKGFSDLWTNVTTWATTVVTNIWNALSALWQKGVDAVTELNDGMYQTIQTVWTNVTSWCGDIVTKAWDELKGLWQTGKDAIDELWNGMKSGFDDLKTNITTWCGYVVQWFKDALGIGSPSTVFADLAYWVKEGFFKGLNADEWWQFASNIMDKVVESFKNGSLDLSKLLDKMGSGIIEVLKGFGIDISSFFGSSGDWFSPIGSAIDWSAIAWDEDFGDRTGAYGTQYHEGIDLNGSNGVSYGSPVYSIGNGTVTFAGSNGGYGNTIKVDYGNGLTAWYNHLSAIGVSVGQTVSRGQSIGNVGSTGDSTGAHLDFRTEVNGVFVDPKTILTASSASGDISSIFKTALEMEGMYTPQNLANLLNLAEGESGMNPTAVNPESDASGQARGILQVKDATFEAYKYPGYNNIYGVLDNALASIRYQKARYGYIRTFSTSGYSVGSRYVPFDMVVPVHTGELIVPKSENIYANSGGSILSPIVSALSDGIVKSVTAISDSLSNAIVSAMEGSDTTTQPIDITIRPEIDGKEIGYASARYVNEANEFETIRNGRLKGER